MSRIGLGRWVGIGLVLTVLGGCSPAASVPPTHSSGSTKGSTGTSSDSTQEALYDYCDHATGQDPKCWTKEFGNNLRAADQVLEAPDEFGGQTQTQVDGAQGLGAGAPVGTDLDMLLATMVGLNFTTIDEKSVGPCRTAWDADAQLGVVTVMTDGPLGQREIVQAYIIGNPVFRIGRPLKEAKAGLGAPGIGVFSSLTDLQASYPDLEVVRGNGYTTAATSPERAREKLATTSTERMMFFLLGADGRVTQWLVGVPQYVTNLCG